MQPDRVSAKAPARALPPAGRTADRRARVLGRACRRGRGPHGRHPLRPLRRRRHARPDRSRPPRARAAHPVPHAHDGFTVHVDRDHADVLGQRPRQDDRDRGLHALPPQEPRAGGQDRRRHRHVRQAAAAGRLSVELVPAHAARPALDQPARLPRDSTAPATSSRARLPISRRPASASCSTSCAATPTISAAMFGPGPGKRQRLLRPRGDRARARQARPGDGRVQRYMDLARATSSTSAVSSRTISTRRRVPAARTRRTSTSARYEYNQSHAPVREQDKVVGHAVRAMYLYSGMADVATEYGDGRSPRSARPAVGRPARQAALRHRRPRPFGRTTKASRPTTTCPTTPPMPRPARRSGSCSGPTACSAWGRTPAMPTPWNSRSTTAPSRACRSTGRRSSTRTRSRARAEHTIAGNGIAAPAARPTWGAWWPRSAAVSTACRTTPSRSTSTVPARRGWRWAGVPSP